MGVSDVPSESSKSDFILALCHLSPLTMCLCGCHPHCYSFSSLISSWQQSLMQLENTHCGENKSGQTKNQNHHYHNFQTTIISNLVPLAVCLVTSEPKTWPFGSWSFFCRLATLGKTAPFWIISKAFWGSGWN